jgi:hypothetical protein
MARSNGSEKSGELGDFQTPPELAAQVCRFLSERGEAPAAVVEPTCGTGNFLIAAFDQFATLAVGVGLDVNPRYVMRTRAALRNKPYAERVKVIRQSFFEVDWADLIGELPDPILVVGNPPWVTNSTLGAFGGTNLPEKTNFQKRNGLDALTGKSNFDISEWMLIKLLEMLRGRTATVAMLCKTAVARKALAHAWKNGIAVRGAEIHPIDAGAFFNAAVDACLFVCRVGAKIGGRECRVYCRFGDDDATGLIGYRDGQLIADVSAYERWKHLAGEAAYQWRSGVKHDCTSVMELRSEGSRYRNGLGELVDLEANYLYPMLKSSEITTGRSCEPRRWMLITQKTVAAETESIRERAPKTWEYLRRHGERLDRRASTIYRNRARFAVFGVGDYTFADWKVAISGFYKKLEFTPIGPYGGKPTVLDDTSYFVACRDEPEAHDVAALLNSAPAREFFSAFIFWDAKRPITIETLRRLDLAALARVLDAIAPDGLLVGESQIPDLR